MSDGDDPRSVKRQQRQALLVGLVIAAVPILCQVLMLCSLIVAPDASWWDDQELAKVAKIIEPDKGQRLWTDDFNNLVSALRLPNDKDY